MSKAKAFLEKKKQAAAAKRKNQENKKLVRYQIYLFIPYFTVYKQLSKMLHSMLQTPSLSRFVPKDIQRFAMIRLYSL